MKSIEKQIDLAISDDYKYKKDVLADVKNLIEENETLRNKTDTLIKLVNIYEFIYNGERDEFYLNVYSKIKNKKIKEGETE